MNEFQNKMRAKLTEKGAIKPCPRCDFEDSAIMDKPTALIVQEQSGMINLTGKYVPVAILICENCGFVSLHALKAIGVEE